MRFEWDDRKARANQAKHAVSFDQAAEAFYDPAAIVKHDTGHSQQEDRYGLLGVTAKGVLVVIYTIRVGAVIRLISARKASRKERRYYYGQERENRF